MPHSDAGPEELTSWEALQVIKAELQANGPVFDKHVVSGDRFEPPPMPSEPALLEAIHKRVKDAITETQHGVGDEWEAVHGRVFSCSEYDEESVEQVAGPSATAGCRYRLPHDSGGPHDD